MTSDSYGIHSKIHFPILARFIWLRSFDDVIFVHFSRKFYFLCISKTFRIKLLHLVWRAKSLLPTPRNRNVWINARENVKGIKTKGQATAMHEYNKRCWKDDEQKEERKNEKIKGKKIKKWNHRKLNVFSFFFVFIMSEYTKWSTEWRERL